MATPLSDNIRALIAYANEKTQAGDTTLGGAVKTLCDGFGGGGNVPSSPFPVPRGPLSSRLAALLTYANETTGAGDTSIGDAVRTLVDGYGAGKELVFYEKLVTDGTAVIQTDYVATLNTVGLYLDGYMSEYTLNAHFLGSTASSAASASSCRIFVSGSTNTAYRRYAYGKIMTGNSPYALLPTGTVISDLKIRVTIDEAGNHNVWAESGGQTGENSYTYTRSNLGSVPLAFFALKYQFQDYRNNLPAGSYIRKVEIEDTELGTLTYVPCTYGGEPGMWCIQKGEFYGNAAESGAFTVEGELYSFDGNYALYSWTKDKDHPLPPYMTYRSTYTETDGTETLVAPVLDLDSLLGTANTLSGDLYFDVKCRIYATANTMYPQFVLLSAYNTGVSRNGSKIYIAATGTVSDTHSGQAKATKSIDVRQYLTYRIERVNGVYKTYVNGEEGSNSGSGLSNNNYLWNTGVYSTGTSATSPRVAFESLRFGKL